MDHTLVFKFKPDTDMDRKLKLHIDLTVATPCSSKFWLTTVATKWGRCSNIAPQCILLRWFSYWRWYRRLDGSKRFLVRHIRGTRYVVGTLPRATQLLWVYTAFECVSSWRISFAQCKPFVLYVDVSRVSMTRHYNRFIRITFSCSFSFYRVWYSRTSSIEAIKKPHTIYPNERINPIDHMMHAGYMAR